MTCKFGNHRGSLRKVRFPTFDGNSVEKTVEICDADAKILQSRTVRK